MFITTLPASLPALTPSSEGLAYVVRIDVPALMDATTTPAPLARQCTGINPVTRSGRYRMPREGVK